MEMTIGTDTVVMLAELLSALGVIGGVVLWLFNFVQQSEHHGQARDDARYRRPKLAEAQLSFPVNLIHNVPFPIS